MNPMIQSFFHEFTNAITHIVFDKVGGHCIIVDPILDYDPKSGRTHTAFATELMQFVLENQLTTEWILETHAHADHLTAAPFLKAKLGGNIAIGENITQVQNVFKNIFNFEESFTTDGSQFDRLLKDNQEINFGHLSVKVMHVPGHTPDGLAYKVGDAIFVGDTIFMPDVGTARCDFPGGDAAELFASIKKILNHPPETRLFMCHDYPSHHRSVSFMTTVETQRQDNIHINDRILKNEFINMRILRDSGLEMPNLLIPAIQTNIRAGCLPPPEKNGISYLKIPLNYF